MFSVSEKNLWGKLYAWVLSTVIEEMGHHELPPSWWQPGVNKKPCITYKQLLYFLQSIQYGRNWTGHWMDKWWCVRWFPPSHPGWSWLLTPGRRAGHRWSQHPAGRHGMPGPTPSALVEAGISEEASWDHEHFNKDDRYFPLSGFPMSILLISILWQKVSQKMYFFAQKISFKKNFLMFSFSKINQHFLCPPPSHPLSPPLSCCSPPFWAAWAAAEQSKGARSCAGSQTCHHRAVVHER